MAAPLTLLRAVPVARVVGVAAPRTNGAVGGCAGVVERPAVAEAVASARRAATAEPVTGPMAEQSHLNPMPSTQAINLPVLSREQKAQQLAALDAEEVRGCTRCRLSQTRKHTVFGEGDPDAKIVFIGEGPGGTEDATGRPFVGRAGQLLDKMIIAMGLRREQVFIANIVKCRAFLPGPPPKDRPPAPDEVATCTPYLQRQIELIRPQVLVTLGLPAARYMLNTTQSMSRLRGNWHEWRGIKLMPTFHPSYVLRSYTKEVREAVWSDLKQVLAELGMPVPKRGGDGA